MMKTTNLTRSTHNRMIGGVASGLSERYGWDLKAVRLLMVASILFPGPQMLMYLVAWAIIPATDEPAWFTPTAAH